jgi:fructuronate reductase/mannitol 2-dehydrogenase
LSEDALSRVGTAAIVPTYDRGALTPSVVHIGVGAFHRSHQAEYLDRLARTGRSTAWGVVGVGLRRRTVTDALAAQDGLYTLVERCADGDRPRVIGCVTRCLFGPDDPEAVVAALADPRTRLVTLTITDGPYGLDRDEPSVVFDYLAAALERRRRAGSAPFTVLSCDNIPSNGDAARRAVMAVATGYGRDLGCWIEETVAFPNSMVDRITPGTTPLDQRRISEALGYEDRAPVITEPFAQWIVEDAFCNGRPPLDEVGVQFVDDVEPYALMKTRLLNGSHSAIGYLGHLAGHKRIDAAMADPVMRRYVRRLMSAEVAPLLPAVEGIDLTDYQHTLIDRFRNPKIADRLGRLCRRGSTKVPAYVVPSIREAREAGRPHELLTLSLAGWLRYLRGVDERGERFHVEDVLAEELRPLAMRAAFDVRPILHERRLFGELGRDPDFAASVQGALASLDRQGARGALATALDAHRDRALAA